MIKLRSIFSGCIFFLLAATVQAADPSGGRLTVVMSFDLPAQPLAVSLRQLASQAGIQIFFTQEAVAGIQAPSVKGSETPLDAVKALLIGTALEFAAEDRTIAVRKKAAAATPPPSTRRSTLAQPQSADLTPAAQPSALSVELEEVVVTASKREERLIETAQSVSVISSDALARMGATEFRDWANTVPGLSFLTSGAGSNQIMLRGVTTGLDNNPTVATYIDDVPIGSSTAFAFGGRLALDPGLSEVDRIEVLRGPQGTLYGASTMGGLIKYVNQQPDLAGFSGYAQSGLSATEDGSVNYRLAAGINMPLGSEAAVRAAAFESHDGGYIDNVTLDQARVNRSDVYGGRVSFLLKPSDALAFQLDGFVQNISRRGDASADYSFSGVPVAGNLDQFHPIAEPFDQRFRLVSGRITYDFGPAILTSISSYQSIETQQVFDLSRLFVPIFQGAYSAVGLPDDESTHKFTQEIRLASGGSRRLDWLIGGFYTRENSEDQEVFALRDQSGIASSGGTFDNPTRYQEYAAFGNLTYHLTTRFDLSAGARYAHNNQDFLQLGSGLFGSNSSALQSSQGVTTYLGNARYHFTNHATGYLRYATGYRPGGPNFVPLNAATGVPEGPTHFGADRLASYEAGYKAESADRRFAVDFAGYYIVWRDIQLQTGLGGFGNGGGAHIQGAELALTGRPVDDLTLSGAFAYQHAYLADASPTVGGSEGERLPNVPRFTAALNADYRIAPGGLEPTVGATLRYVANRTSNFADSMGTPGVAPQYRLPAYTLVDLRGGVVVGSVNLQLYVHNLANERGQLSAFTAYSSAGGAAEVSILQPRTIGFSAMTRF